MVIPPYNWKEIFDKSQNVVFVWSLSGEVLFVSDSIRQFGYSTNEFYTKKVVFRDFVHPDDFDRIHNESHSFVQDKTDFFTMRYRIRTKSGEIRTVDDFTWSDKDPQGNIVQAYGCIVDITTKLGLIDALTESRERFNTIIDLASDIIYDLDLSTQKIELFGKVEVFAEKGNSIPQKYSDVFDLFPPLEALRLQNDISSFLATGNPDSGEYRSRRKDGSFQYWRITASKIQTLPSSHTRIVGSIKEITSDIIINEKLELQHRMDYLSSLTEGLAHNMNNIFTIIIGNLELLSLDSSNLEKEDVLSLQNALNASIHAKDIVHQLQKFSHNQSIPIGSINLHEILQELKQYLKNSIIPKISLKIPENFEKEAYIKGNQSEIVEVLLNLGKNSNDAIREKYQSTDEIHDDFIQITINEMQWEQITPDLKQIDAMNPIQVYYHVAFTDSGIGMSDDVKAQIFKPYFTTKGDKNTVQGKGLGLAMAYYIITERCGGFLTVESQKDRGTTFHIYLPKAQEPLIKSTIFKSQSAVRIKNILVVDDEPQILQFLAQALENREYNVFSMGDGRAVLDFLRDENNQQAIDLVILDLMMPHVSGQIILKEIVKLGLKTKIVIASGYTDLDLTDSCFRSVNGFLQKPFTIDELVKLIKNIEYSSS